MCIISTAEILSRKKCAARDGRKPANEDRPQVDLAVRPAAIWQGRGRRRWSAAQAMGRGLVDVVNNVG